MSSAAPARASGPRSLLAAETLAQLDNREWGCLLIMGPTGSGKTCTLKELSRRYGLPWPQPLTFDPNRAVVSQLGCSPSEALQLMSESGVNTVPTWLTPMCHLSGGEKARIEAAVSLRQGGRVVDDLGCKLDAQAARMASVAVQRTIARLGLRNVIVATSTPELVPWLQPDWVLHLDPSGFQRLVKNPLSPDKRRPQIELRWEKADDPGTPSAPAADARLRPAQSGLLGKKLEVRCRVVTDDFTKHASAAMEHGFDGCVKNVFAQPPRLDPRHKMGCIVGPSGSGKSVTLQRLTGDPEATMIWDVSILHDVTGLAGEQAARARLHAVGLARHTFERSYEELSSGEQELARLARALLPFDTGGDGTVAFDEAFSCLDPNTALRCASGLARFVRDAGNRGARTRLILAGAALGAADLLARLQPDWVFDPSAASFRTFSGARRVVEAPPLLPPPPWDYPALLFKQPVWQGTIRHCNSGRHVWERFKQWHYLSTAFPTNASNHVLPPARTAQRAGRLRRFWRVFRQAGNQRKQAVAGEAAGHRPRLPRPRPGSRTQRGGGPARLLLWRPARALQFCDRQCGIGAAPQRQHAVGGDLRQRQEIEWRRMREEEQANLHPVLPRHRRRGCAPRVRQAQSPPQRICREPAVTARRRIGYASSTPHNAYAGAEARRSRRSACHALHGGDARGASETLL